MMIMVGDPNLALNTLINEIVSLIYFAVWLKCKSARGLNLSALFFMAPKQKAKVFRPSYPLQKSR